MTDSDRNVSDRDVAIAALTHNLMIWIFSERLDWIRDYQTATLNDVPLLSKDRWFSVSEIQSKIVELGGAKSWWAEVRKRIQEELATHDKWRTRDGSRGKQTVWFSGPWQRGYKVTHDPKEAYRLMAFLAKLAEGFGISIADQIQDAKDYGQLPQLMATLDEHDIDVDDLASPIADIEEETLLLLSARNKS